MEEDAKRQVAFAVEQARMKYYPEYGIQLQFDAEKFAELMIPHLGLGEPEQAPAEFPNEQPEVVTTMPEIGITAQITAPEDIVTFGEERGEEPHEFKSDRGGVNCIECRKTEEDGNHG